MTVRLEDLPDCSACDGRGERPCQNEELLAEGWSHIGCGFCDGTGKAVPELPDGASCGNCTEFVRGHCRDHRGTNRFGDPNHVCMFWSDPR